MLFLKVFNDVVVAEGECVCVELIAHDRYRFKQAVLFLGSIRYDALKSFYDSRVIFLFTSEFFILNFDFRTRAHGIGLIN